MTVAKIIGTIILFPIYSIDIKANIPMNKNDAFA